MRRLSVAPFVLVFLAMVGSPATASAQSGVEPFVGEIRYVAFNFAPRGWAQCNGQIMSIAQNTALFSLLGTYYGGNGQTTFALPDMRGRVPVHMGQGPGLSNYDLAQTGGTEATTLTVNQLASHSHPLGASSAEAGAVSPSGNLLGTKQRVPLYNGGLPDVAMSGNAIGPVGGNQPFSQLQPYNTLNCIIALEGIYPSRP
jgi:microcystin-dependent protein